MENLNLDKSSWKKVNFGDVVFEPKETCKDILGEGIEHVLGLEHIDSGDLHLRNSATIEESTTFTKKFKKGDVLFGRRRAYLKKAAQAEFDGICSGDITVFRTKKEKLLPELLPFVVHNDKFFDYAIKHSAGGLSPRVKFKDLANYEFLLPPKEEQAKIAELLWAMDEVIERERDLLESIDNYLFNYVEDFIFNNTNKFIKLESVMSKAKDKRAQDIDRNKILTVRLHLNGVVKNETVNGLKIGATNYFIRKAGQFIYGKQNLFNGAIGIIPEELDGFLSSSDIPTFDINIKKVNPKYLFKYIGRKKYYTQLEKLASGSGSKRISEANFLNIEIALPNIEIQNDFVLEIDRIENVRNINGEKKLMSQSLQRSLINQVF
jgi:type I restriction enzyme S subunit